MTSGGFGLKEMRIAAAWLRQKPLVKALMEEQDSPFLKPILVDAQEGKMQEASRNPSNLYMGYEFYLLKPKEVLIIDPGLQINEARKCALQQSGIDLWTSLPSDPTWTVRPLIGLVKLPQTNEQRRDWLSSLKGNRDKLPGVLLIASGGSLKEDEKPLASSEMDELCYQMIQRELSKDSSNPAEKLITLGSSILKGSQKWVKEVFKKDQAFTLVLHLNPGEDKKAPQGVREKWEKTAKDFNQTFQDQNWNMVVEASGKRYQHFGNTELILYDYHGMWRGRENPECYFYEPCFKTQPTQLLLFNPPADQWIRLFIAFGLVLAAVTHVAIVDERIWNRAKPEEDRALRRVSIQDPTKFLQDPTNFLEGLNDVNILAIHQGILDKGFTTRDEIEKWVEDVKKHTPFVVVISDRGEELLPKLPRNVRFAPFSALEPFALKHQSKYHLVQALLLATRGGKTVADPVDR